MPKEHIYRGYRISRGDYQDTSDNRIDRWYIDPVDSGMRDRRGWGHSTLSSAKQAIDDLKASFGGYA